MICKKHFCRSYEIDHGNFESISNEFFRFLVIKNYFKDAFPSVLIFKFWAAIVQFPGHYYSLCKDILNTYKPINFNPYAFEDVKHKQLRRNYEATTKLYEFIFDQSPSSEIWPDFDDQIDSLEVYPRNKARLKIIFDQQFHLTSKNPVIVEIDYSSKVNSVMKTIREYLSISNDKVIEFYFKNVNVSSPSNSLSSQNKFTCVTTISPFQTFEEIKKQIEGSENSINPLEIHCKLSEPQNKNATNTNN